LSGGAASAGEGWFLASSDLMMAWLRSVLMDLIARFEKTADETEALRLWHQIRLEVFGTASDG
jgi:hypothetical protein